MNSFFIQPSIPEATRNVLAEQIRQATAKSRVESEVWQTENISSELQTALSHHSPTIIPVGSRAWFDQIVTASQRVAEGSLPVFGFVSFVPTKLHPLSPFLIGRAIKGSIGSLAARKVSKLPLFAINDDLFSESCSFSAKAAEASDETSTIKLRLQLNQGQIAINTLASRVDFSLLDTIQDETPLIRLGIRSEVTTKSAAKSITTDLLPINRTSLRTERYEDVLHIPIKKGTLVSSETLVGVSHSNLIYRDSLTIQIFDQGLRCITSKNQPHRY